MHIRAGKIIGAEVDNISRAEVIIVIYNLRSAQNERGNLVPGS